MCNKLRGCRSWQGNFSSCINPCDRHVFAPMMYNTFSTNVLVESTISCPLDNRWRSYHPWAYDIPSATFIFELGSRSLSPRILAVLWDRNGKDVPDSFVSTVHRTSKAHHSLKYAQPYKILYKISSLKDCAKIWSNPHSADLGIPSPWLCIPMAMIFIHSYMIPITSTGQ